MSVIKAIGVELEGGWRSVPDGEEMGHDGSVGGLPREARYVGEIRSAALKVSAFDPWFLNCYPPYVNDTCGLHVHFSFKNKGMYQQFMSEEYRHELFHRLCLWGMDKDEAQVPNRFWERMAGKNGFCKVGPMVPESSLAAVLQQRAAETQRMRRLLERSNEFNAVYAPWEPEAQARAGSRVDARYHAINFCLGMHGTVEIRVLPMFPDAEVALEAVHVLREGTEAFGVARGEADKALLTTVVWEEEAFEGIEVVLDEALSGGLREEVLEIWDDSCTKVAAWPQAKAKSREEF